MKLTPWYLAAVAPVIVAGLSNAFMGQMAVLAVVLSIFIGTVTAGRGTPLTGSAKKTGGEPLLTRADNSSLLAPARMAVDVVVAARKAA
jgi:hypothetical protein